jgi:hypothetical protein
MTEPARLLGGPEDGREVRVRLLGGHPVPSYHVPYRDGIELGPVEPDVSLLVSHNGLYALRLADMGLPSRSDDGALRYDWKGWR